MGDWGSIQRSSQGVLEHTGMENGFQWDQGCNLLSLLLVVQLCRFFTNPRTTQVTRLLCPWNSSGKKTGVGSYFLLQGIFPTQRLNLGLLYCRQILYCLSHREGPNSAIIIPPFLASLPSFYPPPPGHHRASDWAPSATWQLLTSYASCSW